jgi:hypothetical protein
MNKLLIITLALLTIGCTEPYSKPNLELETFKGKARHDAFVECMELASKITRQSDDDVSDIVEGCSAQSYYMTNYISVVDK